MPRVLLMHTGGTLGMTGSPLAPGGYASHLMDLVPELEQLAELESHSVCNVDSSDVNPAIWGELARIIDTRRDDFDGFVIIHGTDTMAYTASALAFALEGLDRPVVLTGAQRPLTALRTDARRNLTDAIDLATRDIPEVGICFDGLLLRGCRTTKSNALDYRAFDSPGCAPLARLGVDVEMGAHIRRPAAPFRCSPGFDDRVLAVQLTPGLSPAVLAHAINAESGVRGVVLSAFGAGTIPSRDPALGDVLARAHDDGVEVLVITSSTGPVNLHMYKNSKPLLEAGVIPGGQMRIEAAVTKLMHALANYDNRNARRRYLEWNVAGELA